MDNPTDRREEFFENALNLAEREITRHTVPLYQVNPKGRLQSLGSGVFLKKSEDFFILTAAHVVASQDPIFVHCVCGPVHLVAHFSHSKSKKIDAAIICLATPFGQLLCSTYEPLFEGRILLNHEGMKFNHYCVVGFPANKIEYGENSFNVRATILSALKNADVNINNYYDFPREDFYVLQMHGKTLDDNDQKVRLKKPQGMSGCGLWFINYKIVRDEMRMKYSLIGIMTESIKERFNVMVGVNIKHSLECLDIYQKNKNNLPPIGNGY